MLADYHLANEETRLGYLVLERRGSQHSGKPSIPILIPNPTQTSPSQACRVPKSSQFTTDTHNCSTCNKTAFLEFHPSASERFNNPPSYTVLSLGLLSLRLQSTAFCDYFTFGRRPSELG